MKRKLLYALMFCGDLFIASACSNDYEDATSPHVYGPDENPPVKSDATSTISNVYEMQGANSTPISISVQRGYRTASAGHAFRCGDSRHEGYGICGPGAEGILGRMILAAGILKKV